MNGYWGEYSGNTVFEEQQTPELPKYGTGSVAETRTGIVPYTVPEPV